MRLIKLLIALLAMHMGFGFTQMVVSYFAGDVADYGAAGWVSHTPIGTFIDLDRGPMQDQAADPAAPKKILDFVNNLGDGINGLLSFDYGFLSDIQPDDGFVYMIVVAFRIISTLFSIGLAVALIYFLFDSGLLTSTLGLAAVGLGAAVTTATSIIGAVNP